MNLETYTSKDGCTLLASVLSFNVQYSEKLEIIMKIITLLSCVFFAVLAFVSKVRWEKFLAVSMILIILPSHSGYYCILYTVPAMIAFLNEKEHVYSDLLVLLAFIMIMQPFQMESVSTFFNYHVALLIITVLLLFRCLSTVMEMKQKKHVFN